MSLSSQAILITGGAGFIGTHLARHFVKAGRSVRVLDIAKPREPVSGVQYLNGDVRNAEDLEPALQGCGAVFHFAAIVSVPLCQSQPFESFTTNLGGTALVLETIRTLQEKSGNSIRVIFAGSSAAYGASGQHGIALKETEPLSAPLSFYASQKTGGEQLLQLYHDVHALETVGFRFFNVYGPGQDPSSPYSGVISIFSKLLATGQALQLNDSGRPTRDFVSVHDVVRACAETLNLSPKFCDGRPINLGSGQMISIRELAEQMMRAADKKVALSDAPPRSGDVQDSLADITRARELLKWSPKISLAEGLRELS